MARALEGWGGGGADIICTQEAGEGVQTEKAWSDKILQNVSISSFYVELMTDKHRQQ